MVINDAGRQIIMTFESCQLKPYLCPAGKWTAGYGHVAPEVEQWHLIGRSLTQHEAEVILEYDLQRFEACVGKTCPKATSNQFSAMVCLAFNIGEAAFKASSLVKKLNAGAPLSAAEEFPRWVHGGTNPDGSPRVLPGLVKRRAAERALFLTPVS